MAAMLGGLVTHDLRVVRSQASAAFEQLVEDRLDACYRLAAVLLADRLKRDKLRRAIDLAAGALVRRGQAPMTRDEVSAWVEQLRSEETE